MDIRHHDTSNVNVVNASDSTLRVNVSQNRRLEEYVSLRQEMLQLHMFCRQVLYWTLAFVVLGIGWHIGKTDPKLSAFSLGIILLASIGLSSHIYFYHQMAISRVGSFIAVFWESRIPGTDLTWHRYNRQARVHGVAMLPSAKIIYVASATTTFFIIFILGLNEAEKDDLWYLFGCGMVILFTVILLIIPHHHKTLRDFHEQWEEEWKKIKYSGAEQDKIYNRYESPPFTM